MCSKEHGLYFQKFPSDVLCDLSVYLENYQLSGENGLPEGIWPQGRCPAGSSFSSRDGWTKGCSPVNPRGLLAQAPLAL